MRALIGASMAVPTSSSATGLVVTSVSDLAISARRRYFGVEPGRYFGVGPGSYECYGYDCNW